MSEILENLVKNNIIENENDIKNEKQENSKDKADLIDPTSLLSKDLLNQIYSLEEKEIGEKKENTQDFMQLDETQKESVENDEEEEYILEMEKEMDKDNFDIEIFKNEENEKIKTNKNNENKNKKHGRRSEPIIYPQKIMNFNPNQKEDSNFPVPIGRFSYDCPQFENDNGVFNNPLQNQLNFFNNSFTMNGKSGWICAHCKNFNYESKLKYNI